MGPVRRLINELLTTEEGNIKTLDEVESLVHSVFTHCKATDSVSKIDVYKYIQLKTKAVASSATSAKFFEELDLSRDGYVSREELRKGLLKQHRFLLKEREVTGSGTNCHVIPGSSKLNSLSNTSAFKLQVIRKGSMKRLYDTFREVDKDDDGHITLPEFKKYLQLKKPNLAEMANGIFKSLDKESTGRVTFRSLLRMFFPEASKDDIRLLLKMARPKKPGTAVTPDEKLLEEVASIFKVYDEDGSGALDLQEFVSALELAGFTPEDSREMFDDVDEDGSGEVTFDEFKKWYMEDIKRQAVALAKLADLEDDSDED